MYWGSASVNPATNVMIVNSMRVPYTVELRPREEAANLDGNDQVGANAQEGTPYRRGARPASPRPGACSPRSTSTAARCCGSARSAT